MFQLVEFYLQNDNFLYKIFKIYTILCRFTINTRIIKFIRLDIPIIVKYGQYLYNLFKIYLKNCFILIISR